LDGQSTTLEALKSDTARKLIYTSAEGDLYLLIIKGKVFIDAELINPHQLSHIKHYFKVLSELEYSLLDKGITEVFAIVSDEKRWRFAQYLGFVSTGVVFNDKYEVVRKVLLK
jgi:hypothetical protein